MTPQELDEIALQVRLRRPTGWRTSKNPLYVVEEGACPSCSAPVHIHADRDEGPVMENFDGTPHACRAA